MGDGQRGWQWGDGHRQHSPGEGGRGFFSESRLLSRSAFSEDSAHWGALCRVHTQPPSAVPTLALAAPQASLETHGPPQLELPHHPLCCALCPTKGFNMLKCAFDISLEALMNK